MYDGAAYEQRLSKKSESANTMHVFNLSNRPAKPG